MLHVLRKFHQNCVYTKPKPHEKLFKPILWQYLSNTDGVFVPQPALSPNFQCLSSSPVNTGLGQDSPLFPYILFVFILFFFLRGNVSLVVQMKGGPFHFKLIITVWLEKNNQENFILLVKTSAQCREEFSWFRDHKAVGEGETIGWKS